MARITIAASWRTAIFPLPLAPASLCLQGVDELGAHIAPRFAVVRIGVYSFLSRREGHRGNTAEGIAGRPNFYQNPHPCF
jgi:hypothetical protein